jgi:hypothetical protein
MSTSPGTWQRRSRSSSALALLGLIPFAAGGAQAGVDEQIALAFERSRGGSLTVWVARRRLRRATFAPEGLRAPVLSGRASVGVLRAARVRGASDSLHQNPGGRLDDKDRRSDAGVLGAARPPVGVRIGEEARAGGPSVAESSRACAWRAVLCRFRARRPRTGVRPWQRPARARLPERRLRSTDRGRPPAATDARPSQRRPRLGAKVDRLQPLPRRGRLDDPRPSVDAPGRKRETAARRRPPQTLAGRDGHRARRLLDGRYALAGVSRG